MLKHKIGAAACGTALICVFIFFIFWVNDYEHGSAWYIDGAYFSAWVVGLLGLAWGFIHNLATLTE